jgi:L-seryl-tRNA(Ser) seleniumtransferase
MSHFRAIPSIEQLRQRPAVRVLEQEYGAAAIVQALREAAAALRALLAAGHPPGAIPTDQERASAWLEQEAVVRLRQVTRASLRPVINATGVVVHTNLGRAPLAESAIEAVAQLAAGYTNLEYDLAEGARGARDTHAEALLCRLLGADAGIVVNNNAAATLLLLAGTAAGREVIVSRGELVEIGGGFRIPDVMAQSGATLREVGTTNKTRIADYRAAITDRTGLLLRVHRSNFRIEGFTEQPSLRELADLGRETGVPVAEDLGSGFVGLPGETGQRLRTLLEQEPTVQESLSAGISLVCFSGDKLLGGPQAGIIVGRADLVGGIRRHPLMRAMRAGRLTYAALEATLVEYVAGRADRSIPVLSMVLAETSVLETRAAAILEKLGSVPALTAQAVSCESAVGGGTTPGLEIPSRALMLTLPGSSAADVERRLRQLEPPVIARVEQDRVLLDLRTVRPDQDDLLARLIASLGQAAGGSATSRSPDTSLP